MKTALQAQGFPTRFSMDFLTSVKLFQRESNSCLCVPLNCSRSLMICITQHKTTQHREPTLLLRAWLFLAARVFKITLGSHSPTNEWPTLMMAKRDLVSSSECSRMCSNNTRRLESLPVGEGSVWGQLLWFKYQTICYRLTEVTWVTTVTWEAQGLCLVTCEIDCETATCLNVVVFTILINQ